MNRLEKYRGRRTLRQKYFFSILIFLFLLVAGLLSVDYSMNALLYGHKGITIFSVANKQTYLEIELMNSKIDINTLYLNRDLNRLKNEIDRLLGK